MLLADQLDTIHTERQQIREMTRVLEQQMWQFVGIKTNFIYFILFYCNIFQTHSGFHLHISSSEVLISGQINLDNDNSECKEGISRFAVLYSGIYVFETRLGEMPFRLKFVVISPSTSIYTLGQCLTFGYDKLRCGRTEYVVTMASRRTIADVQTFSKNSL
jgi:hypothetical protein